MSVPILKILTYLNTDIVFHLQSPHNFSLTFSQNLYHSHHGFLNNQVQKIVKTICQNMYMHLEGTCNSIVFNPLRNLWIRQSSNCYSIMKDWRSRIKECRAVARVLLMLRVREFDSHLPLSQHLQNIWNFREKRLEEQ